MDHAHLHLVPLDLDLLHQVRPFVPKSLRWIAGNWDERAAAHSVGLDYLYCKREDARGFIAVSDDFGSQVFRRAISAYLEIEEEFNWRDHPKLEIVDQTISALDPLLDRLETIAGTPDAEAR